MQRGPFIISFEAVFTFVRSEPHPSMKLMFVGVANIGKTTLLNQLRQEGTGSYQNSPPVGWTERKVRKKRTGSVGKQTTAFLAHLLEELHILVHYS